MKKYIIWDTNKQSFLVKHEGGRECWTREINAASEMDKQTAVNLALLSPTKIAVPAPYCNAHFQD